MRVVKLWILAATSAFLLSACAIWVTPDTPANAAIQLMSAIQAGDFETASSLICDDDQRGDVLDPSEPEPFGSLAPLIEAHFEHSANEHNLFGGDPEYSALESVDLDADRAWTDLDYQLGNGKADVWRLHMVREGQWRACSVEHLGEMFRPSNLSSITGARPLQPPR